MGVIRPAYRDSNDQMKHMNVIARLSQELERPVHDICPLYEDILGRLRQQAQIQDYLPILVSKKVKNLLGASRRMPSSL